jgi:hypothetical protein
MRKSLSIVLLTLATFCVFTLTTPATAAPAKTTTIAVVLLGSFEYQNQDYYDLAYTALLNRFPSNKFHLMVGEYPQLMFNRFSDKKGLLPGETPTPEKMAEFAWTHSFNEVLFVLLSAPHIKSDEITLQWENPEVTITAHAFRFDARTRKKLAEASSTQSAKALNRSEAKQATFRKCFDALQEKL